MSIIVPMYNVEEYIQETIESLLSQPFDEIEIIVVDDKSTDNSYKIAAHFATIDDRIVLIKQSENKGVSVARNTGIKRARGQFIFFLDGDDTIPDDTIGKMYEAAATHNADIVTGVYERFDRKGSAPANFFNQFPELKVEGDISIYSCPPLLYSVYSCGKLFKRDLIQNERFIDQLGYGEDQVFTITAFLRSSRIYNLSATVYNYRVRDGSQSQSVYLNPIRNLENLFVMLRELQIIFNQYIADETSRIKLYSTYFSRALHWNIWTAISNGLLSYSVPTRVEILEKYKQWLNEIPDFLFITNRQDFDLVNLKLEKIAGVIDNTTKQSYVSLLEQTREKFLL
ncbi:glycosyltransferase family 2 protein [Paenibacillus timonensis]|uniref:glycosyltransferase family 2 protein n=1 Tax=Paenibacillus timonensis TaxID=225915 RepID=UPI003F961E40